MAARESLLGSAVRARRAAIEAAATGYRTRLLTIDHAYADGLGKVLKALSARMGKGSVPSAVARYLWVTEVPSFGSLSGPEVDLRRGVLILTETRAVAARFDVASWRAGPADDPLAERTDPAVGIVRNELSVGRKFARFNVRLLALVAMPTVVGFLAAGEGRDADAITAALSDLAAALVARGAPEPGPIEVPAEDGRWLGDAALAPNGPRSLANPTGAPGAVVPMLSGFEA
jgi:hypothetical protein